MVMVDGWTCPSDSNRLCLGVLRNPTPHPDVENIKRHICNGIEIAVVQSRITIKNITEYAIFVQSQHVNKLTKASFCIFYHT